MFFFDVLQCVELSRETELHAYLIQQLMQMLCDLSSRIVVAFYGVRKGVSLVDGDSISDAVSRIKYDTSCSAC